MRFRIAPVALAATLIIAPARLTAQGIPLGPEAVVNSYTTSAQTLPSVSSDGTGRFVVVWTSQTQDGAASGIFGQRFSAAGAKAGPEFQINTFTTGYQQSASVATDPFGRSVAIWTSLIGDQDGSASGVFGRRFDATGGMLGGEFQVNTFTTGDQFVSTSTCVATDQNGNFVAVWRSYGQDGDDGGVFAQRFDAAGAKDGLEFQVNTTTAGDQKSPAVAMSPTGDFAVVWVSSDGSNTGVFGQRFDPSGSRVGSEFQANTYTAGGQGSPVVAIAKAGEFLVVWNSLEQDGSNSGIFGQRFNGSAEKVGAEFQVNTYTTGFQTVSSVAADASGRFLVTWTSPPDGSGRGVFGQRFDRSGARIATDFQINSFTTDSQADAKVASDGLGFVMAWDSASQDGSTYGIAARKQNLVPQELSVDGNPAAGTLSDSNGVLEPGETVLVSPEWKNVGEGTLTVEGSAASLDGPPGPAYSLSDATANYGDLLPNGAVNCFDGGPTQDCYLVGVSGVRPALHWDASLTENLSTNGGQPWTIHVGQSFTDVPKTQLFYAKIETILHAGITGGCGGTQYCPDASVPRDQMAIFVAKTIAGSGELVPVSGRVAGQPYRCGSGGISLYADVGVEDTFCKHVHYIAAQNVTLGCDVAKYCPAEIVTRDAMASFIAKAMVAPSGGSAVPESYGPDPKTGLSYSCNAASPNTHFTDVSASNQFCRHIHFLWAKGIISGCLGTQYCPTDPVHRDAMAKFIANAFGLRLNGP